MLKIFIRIASIFLAWVGGLEYFGLVLPEPARTVGALAIAAGAAILLMGKSVNGTLILFFLPVLVWPGATWLIVQMFHTWTIAASGGLAMIPAAAAGVVAISFSNSKDYGEGIRAWIALQIGFIGLYLLKAGVTHAGTDRDVLGVFAAGVGCLFSSVLLLQTQLIPPETRRAIFQLVILASFSVVGMGMPTFFAWIFN